MINYILAFSIVFFIGILEGILILRAGGTGRKIIFNHFSWYHIFLFILLILVLSATLQDWTYIFLFVVIQDVASHMGSESLPKNQDWINWPFYWQLFGVIPLIYIVLIILYIITGVIL